MSNTMQAAERLSLVQPRYFRKADAAKYLGISVRALSGWMTAGLVSFSKMSHKVCLFKVQDLDAAIERVRVKAIGEAS